MYKTCIKCNELKEETLFELYRYKNVKGEIILKRPNICKDCRRKRYKELYYNTDGTKICKWTEKYGKRKNKSNIDIDKIRTTFQGAVITEGDKKIYTNNMSKEDVLWLRQNGYNFIFKK